MNGQREVLVGVVVIAAVLVAVVGTLWLQGYGFGREERTIRARVLEVGQLTEGNDVRLRGVAIGQVRGIEVEPDGQAVLVTMRIRPDVTLPADPVVIVAPESMFGDWQAEITSRSQFPRFRYAEAPENDVIPGHALPDVSRLTAAADEIATNLRTLTDRVETAFTEETARNIAMSVDNIQRISRRLTELVGQQAQTFDNLASRVETSADELGSAARAARNTFERIDTILVRTEVDSILDDSRVAMENIRGISENLEVSTRDLESTLSQADTTFSRLNRITGRLESGEGTLGRLLSDTVFVQRAESAITELQLLLEDFRRNPKRYVRLSIF